MTTNKTSSALDKEKVTYTFEEVYAMKYVQDSIRSIISSNSRNYPMMASYEDDIKQEMLIYLAKSLSTFNPQKSNIKTFCRFILTIGLQRARREYFTETQKNLSLAIPIDNILSPEQNGYGVSISTEDKFLASGCVTTPFEEQEKREEFYFIYNDLPEKIKIIANAIMNGLSFSEIWQKGICSHRYLYSHALPHMRKKFKKIF